MSQLYGLKVRLPDTEPCHRCGSAFAFITRSTGPHFADLDCAQCGARCGALSERTAKLFEQISNTFGAPEVLTLRRPKPVSRSREKTSPDVSAK
jgi:hypothetical protein